MGSLDHAGAAQPAYKLESHGYHKVQVWVCLMSILLLLLNFPMNINLGVNHRCHFSGPGFDIPTCNITDRISTKMSTSNCFDSLGIPRDTS